MTPKRRARKRKPRGADIDLGALRFSKGRRAKRGRRIDYMDVFLHSGITDIREAEAGEALLFLNKDNKSASTANRKSCATGLPSKVFGFREEAERLISYVGHSDEAPVAFCIPQVADALGNDAATTAFLIDVLVALDMAMPTTEGNFLWKGRQSVWDRLDDSPLQDGCQLNDLSEFCACLLDVLRHCKEVVCLEEVGMEIERRLVNTDRLRLWHRLHCVNAVLVAAGIVQQIQTDAGKRYRLRSSGRVSSAATEPSMDSSTPTVNVEPATDALREESPRQTTATATTTSSVTTAAPPLTNKYPDLKTVLDSVLRQANTLDNSGPGFLVTEATLPSSRAAVMEIVDGDINHVGIFDVLKPTAVPSSRTNSMIALALPQWMFMHQPRHPHPAMTHQAHVYAFNSPRLNTRPRCMETEPHLHMAHAQVLQTTSPGFLNKVTAMQRDAFQASQAQGQYSTVPQFKHHG